MVQHVKKTAEKVDRTIKVLARIIPNQDIFSSGKRRILVGVVHSVLMYAVPAWIDIVKVKKYRRLMERCQRKALLRVASAYRTVSREALSVITCTPPIDVLMNMRTSI